MNREALKSLLRHHEGLKLEAYRCPRGRLTIGYGHTGPDVFDGMKVTEEEAEKLLERDCASVVTQCRQCLEWFNRLDDSRQNVVCSMVFNMGLRGFSDFKKTVRYIALGDYAAAANEMLCSDWAGQVGRRAVELAQMMRSGDTIH